MILCGGNCLFCCSPVPTLRVKSSEMVHTRGAWEKRVAEVRAAAARRRIRFCKDISGWSIAEIRKSAERGGCADKGNIAKRPQLAQTGRLFKNQPPRPLRLRTLRDFFWCRGHPSSSEEGPSRSPICDFEILEFLMQEFSISRFPIYFLTAGN